MGGSPAVRNIVAMGAKMAQNGETPNRILALFTML
jgi:hypothetical protein